MRLLLFASKNMGVLALNLLFKKGAQIVAVVTRPDDPSKEMWYPSVTELAHAYNLPVLQAANINDSTFIEKLKSYQPDRIFCAFYPQIFSKELLAIVPQGALNLHFAPLPRYRGCFPGAWAIINGENQHGVTIHHISAGVDNGAIAFQAMTAIAHDETGISLYKKCETLGETLLAQHAKAIIASEKLPSQTQDENKVLYYPRGNPYQGVINWGWSAEFIERYIRALTFPPFQNPITFIGSDKIEIKKVERINQDSDCLPGTLVDSKDLLVQCGKGIVKIIDYAVVNKNNRNKVHLTECKMLGL